MDRFDAILVGGALFTLAEAGITPAVITLPPPFQKVCHVYVTDQWCNREKRAFQPTRRTAVVRRLNFTTLCGILT